MEADLTNEEVGRYSRQLLLPEISVEGQRKLKKARVLIIGAGGLGAPAGFYLAGAGVGTIGIVDGDKVEKSNLHRQIIHNIAKVGVNKAESAKQALNLFNELVNIKTYEEFLTPENAEEIVKDYDIILDASDNAKTRYLVNDVCMIQKKILVSGSALKWDGQITLYGYKDGPCYRCLFPLPPPPSCTQNCSVGGVLGIIPGIIGQLQALETVKLILGLEDVLYKKMILFDGVRTHFRTVKLRGRNPDCSVCGDNPTVTKTKDFDYDDFCQTNCNVFGGIQLNEENKIEMEEFAKVLKGNDDFVFIDVRPEEQFKIVSVEKSISFPYDNFDKHIQKIKELSDLNNKPVYVMCRSGNASKGATRDLLQNGFTNVKNVNGGIFEYIAKIDSSLPKY